MSRSKQKRGRAQLERVLFRLRKDLGIKTLDEVKRSEIERVLALTKGDKVLTAALLGIGKTTVYRSLEQ